MHTVALVLVGCLIWWASETVADRWAERAPEKRHRQVIADFIAGRESK